VRYGDRLGFGLQGGRSGGFGGSGLGLRRRLGLHRTAQALGVGQAPDAVGLSILDARGMALHADAQALAEV
jgi:hypothetical protein